MGSQRFILYLNSKISPESDDCHKKLLYLNQSKYQFCSIPKFRKNISPINGGINTIQY